jgi:epoxyqueuosine reductase
MRTITDMLQSEFTKLQAKFRTVSIGHIKDLQTELTRWQREGFITKKFYEQNYSQFVFHPSATLTNAHSIIVLGIPQKVTRIEFFNNGKRYHTILPPTYIFSPVRAACKEILSKILGKKGYSVDRAILPMKLLAVKSGLGKYGKNNLCYVDGMGSYTRLEAFYTDYEFPVDNWYEKELMKSCSSCSLCQHTCPTQCIPNDRILIHADHCLTYFNENIGVFPPSIPKQSHNALIGCMHCQIVCPQNKKYLEYNQNTITFTEEEISCILQKTPRENIPQTLAKKLIDIDIYEDYPELPRNFTVLIDKKNAEDSSKRHTDSLK